MVGIVKRQEMGFILTTGEVVYIDQDPQRISLEDLFVELLSNAE